MNVPTISPGIGGCPENAGGGDISCLMADTLAKMDSGLKGLGRNQELINIPEAKKQWVEFLSGIDTNSISWEELQLLGEKVILLGKAIGSVDKDFEIPKRIFNPNVKITISKKPVTNLELNSKEKELRSRLFYKMNQLVACFGLESSKNVCILGREIRHIGEKIEGLESMRCNLDMIKYY